MTPSSEQEQTGPLNDPTVLDHDERLLLLRWAGTTDDRELKALVGSRIGKLRLWLASKVAGTARLHAFAEGWHRMRRFEDRR